MAACRRCGILAQENHSCQTSRSDQRRIPRRRADGKRDCPQSARLLSTRAHRKRNRRSLSPREIQVLEALIEGHSYKAIADKLFLSIHTVRPHLQNIYAKLHVNTRTEAIAKALKSRMV
ncbi:MAG: hypothetical protein C4326_07510 [Ignavibacteria bacterium]